MAAADVFQAHQTITDEQIHNRSYTVTVTPNDALESLWMCLAAVYGTTMGSQDENVVENKVSRMEMLRRKKEARLSGQQDRADSTRIANESPWTMAREKITAKRRERCTGEAIEYAIDLASVDPENASRTARILLFTNGCPNHGAGSVVSFDSVGALDKARADIVDPSKLPRAVEYFKILGEVSAETGIAIDVMCTGALELALTSYQALVEPSSGYVLPHVSFDTENLRRNVDFLLKQTHVSGLFFSQQNDSKAPLRDDHWRNGCIIDIRMPG
jgi:hypothetical protein